MERGLRIARVWGGEEGVLRKAEVVGIGKVVREMLYSNRMGTRPSLPLPLVAVFGVRPSHSRYTLAFPYQTISI